MTSPNQPDSPGEATPAATERAAGARTAIPDAVVEPRRRRSFSGGLVWLLPVVALVASALFTWFGVRGRGPTIVVHATHGYGVGPGDSVRYLGIDVGVVSRVTLGDSVGAREPDADHAGVRVAGANGAAAEPAGAPSVGAPRTAGVRLEIQMRKEAAHLARAGTRFWIVRPELTIDSVEGLETIIGARYLALFPGPSGAERRTQFTALPVAPLAEELSGDRGLEIVLEAPTRFGLQPGAGVTYRGVRIGTVIAVGLASDATSVEVRALIRSAYAQLVRERSVFWETGGFELGLSLTGGLEVDLDSMRSALVGGIAMATPLDAGPVVSTGWRYRLHGDAKDEWLDWAPALPLGSELLPPGVLPPTLLRGVLTWDEGRILRTKRTRAGWMHVDRGGLQAPVDLFTIPEDARGGRAQLEVAGRSFDLASLLAESKVERGPGGLGRLDGSAFGDGWSALESSGFRANRPEPRALIAPEDLIVFRDSGRDPVGIDASRLRVEGDRTTVDDRIPLGEGWHGALVLARSDGAVVGVLVVQSDRSGIVPARW